jgi:hypothetical protein
MSGFEALARSGNARVLSERRIGEVAGAGDALPNPWGPRW